MTQSSNKPPATPLQAAACAGRLDALLDPHLFKALCDPTRVLLLSCLARCGRACSVSEVAECVSVDLSVVSRHLALLARARVVEADRDGRIVRYRVRYDELAASLHAIAAAIEECCPEGEPCCGSGIAIRKGKRG